MRTYILILLSSILGMPAFAHACPEGTRCIQAPSASLESTDIRWEKIESALVSVYNSREIITPIYFDVLAFSRAPQEGSRFNKTQVCYFVGKAI